MAGAALIDTDAASRVQTFPMSGASSVAADFETQYAYVADGSSSVGIFGPCLPRPLMAPRIWSSEEVNWNIGYPGEFLLMATGDPLPTLELSGTLPEGLSFVDNGDGTATVSGTPTSAGPGCGGGDPGGEGDPEGGDVCGEFAFALTATNSQGVYAQALGMTVYTPAEFITAPTATFTEGSASSFTVAATSATTPILYTWDEEPVMAPGVQLVDHENGTASLQGTPTTPGTYHITIGANTGFLTDESDTTQLFTLIVNPAGTAIAPTITSPDTVTWEVIGAPFAPDQFTVTSIGSPTPALSVEGTLPPGVNFIDNGDSTATFGGNCQVAWPGMEPECLGLLPAAAAGDWTFNIRATNDSGATYATQTFTLHVETATSIMTPGPDAPANLAFAYTPGGPLPPAQTFSVRTLGDTIPYAAVTTADWLSALPRAAPSALAWATSASRSIRPDWPPARTPAPSSSHPPARTGRSQLPS